MRPLVDPPALWRRWVVANVAGEVVGFGAAGALMALLGPAMAGATGPAALLLTAALTVLVASVEGSVVGAAQWRVLRADFPAWSGRWSI